MNDDFRITTNYKDRDDRNVLNTKEIPEYMKLNTHFREERGDLKNYDKYDSVEFSDSSFDFMAATEDEAVVSGLVKPIKIKKNNTANSKGEAENTDNAELLFEELMNSGNESSPKKAILNKDTVTTEVLTSDSNATTHLPDFMYNPILLCILLIISIALIVGEVIGLYFLLR